MPKDNRLQEGGDWWKAVIGAIGLSALLVSVPAMAASRGITEDPTPVTMIQDGGDPIGPLGRVTISIDPDAPVLDLHGINCTHSDLNRCAQRCEAEELPNHPPNSIVESVECRVTQGGLAACSCNIVTPGPYFPPIWWQGPGSSLVPWLF